VVLASSGCFGGDPADLARFANDFDETALRDFLTATREGRFDDANMRLALNLHDSVPQAQWDELSAMLEPVALDSIYLVGALTNTTNGFRRAQITYEAPVDDGWLLLGFALDNGSITAFQWNRSNETLGEQNAFRLSNLSPARALIILVGIISLGISLVAFGLVLRSNLPRRPLWAFLSLVGLGGCMLNWSTGAWAVRIMVSLPVFQVSKAGPYAAWTFNALVPLGALVALWKLKAAADQQKVQGDPSPETSAA